MSTLISSLSYGSILPGLGLAVYILGRTKRPKAQVLEVAVAIPMVGLLSGFGMFVVAGLTRLDGGPGVSATVQFGFPLLLVALWFFVGVLCVWDARRIKQPLQSADFSPTPNEDDSRTPEI
jgi:hypothetical protein